MFLVVDDLLVYLIREHYEIVIDGQIGDPLEVIQREYSSGGIRGGVQDDHLGIGSNLLVDVFRQHSEIIFCL